MDDAREYLETRNAMDIVGISQDEQVRVCVHYVQKQRKLEKWAILWIQINIMNFILIFL